MPDALASAALVLAALALILSVWTPAIDAALKRGFSPNQDARAAEKAEVLEMRNRRAFPLALSSWLVLLIFAPRDMAILCGVQACFGADAASCRYDDVAAIFLATQLIVLLLAFSVTQQVFALTRKAG